MAHYTKFNRAACGHMFKHYERAKEEDGEYIKFGNQNIDTSRTEQNYNLGPNHMNGQGGFVRERCSEVKMQKRADVNVMCSWVVTAPKDIQSDETDKFFRETYNFLSDRYGKDNVISAYVHMDEITPHMHFAFVPVVVDKKKGILKVSAKEAVTKKDLDMFHQHYSKYMESIFGRDIGVLNEATKEGNKSIDELKRGTAQKELAEMKRETEEVIKLKESEEKRLQEDKEQIESLKNEKVALKKEIGELEKIFKGKQLDREDLERIQPIENIFGSIKNVTVKDIQNLKKMAMTNLKDRTDLVNAQREIKRLSEDNTRLQGQIPTLMEKMEQAKKEAELTNKNQKLTNDCNFVVRKYNTLVQAIHQLPEAEQQFIREIVEPPKTEIKERDMGYEIGD